MAAIPSAIGPYRIQLRLGAGGMGSVYLGYDSQLRRPVAVKFLNDGVQDPGARERFMREAHYAGRLRHQNIVTIFGIGDHHGRPYIVMEYLPGETLADLIARRARLSMRATLGVMTDICDGLSHAHRMGILHRDVKPANVMVDIDGTAKIVDFGVARRAESNLTQTGAVLGTLNYLSPEQLGGRAVDARSDVFAVGAVFYELLAGRRAFPGGIDDGLLEKILLGNPTPLGGLCPDVPADIDACIAKALAKRPEDRFQDLDAMRAEILRIQAGCEGDPRWPTPKDELAAVVIGKSIDAEIEAAREERPVDPSSDAPTRLSGEELEAVHEPPATGSDRAALELSADESVAAGSRRPGRGLRIAVAVLIVVAVTGATATWWRQSRAMTGPIDAVQLEETKTQPVTSSSPPSTGETGRGSVDRALDAGPSPPPPSVPTSGAGPQGPTPGARDFVAEAQAAYRRNAREQGLELLKSALRTDGQNTAAIAVARSWLTVAREECRIARDRAVGLGTIVTAASSYENARRIERFADLMARTEPTEATRLFWAASTAYQAAFEAGNRALALQASLLIPTNPSTPIGTGLGLGAVRPDTVVAPPPPVIPPAPGNPPAAGRQPEPAPSAAASGPPSTSGAGSARAEGPPSLAGSMSPAPTSSAAIPLGAREALDQYATAYSRQDINGIKKVFPALPRDREDTLKKAFRSGCRSYQVVFVNLEATRVTADSMTILARTAYTCTPATGQARRTSEDDDVFYLKRVGDIWIIERMQLM